MALEPAQAPEAALETALETAQTLFKAAAVLAVAPAVAAAAQAPPSPPEAPPAPPGQLESDALHDREPVALITAVESATKTVVLAVISLGLAFHWFAWSKTQNGAVLGVLTAVFVLVSAVTAAALRQKVTPVKAPRS